MTKRMLKAADERTSAMETARRNGLMQQAPVEMNHARGFKYTDQFKTGIERDLAWGNRKSYSIYCGMITPP